MGVLRSELQGREREAQGGKVAEFSCYRVFLLFALQIETS